MKRYNYFDDDDDIVEKNKTHLTKEDLKNDLSKEKIAEAIKAFSLKEKDRVQSVRTTIAKARENDFQDIAKSKRIIITLVCVLLIIAVFGSMIATVGIKMHNENKRIAAFTVDAGKVCNDFVALYGNCSYENLSAYDIDGYRLTGLCAVREMDFNNDKTSELLLGYYKSGAYYIEIWGYDSKDKFVKLYDGSAVTSNDKKTDSWVTIYRKSNKYYIAQHDKEDISKVTLFSLKNDKFEKTNTKCSYDSELTEYLINGKIGENRFEKIKFSVLSHNAAINNSELVYDIIDEFDDKSNKNTAKNKQPGSSQSMRSAYYNIIQDYNQRFGKAVYKEENGIAYLDGLGVVKLVDFNNDDVDELVLIYRRNIKVRGEDRNGNYISQTQAKYYCDIYTYNGTSAKLAYQSDGISNNLNDASQAYFILKYQNNKCFLCSNNFSSSNYGRVVSATSSVLKFDGNIFKSQFKARYAKEYGYGHYYIDDKEVYKSVFNDKGYQVPMFDGTSQYDEDVYKITFTQSKITSEINIEGEVEKTISAIRTLDSTYDGSIAE